MTLYEIRNPYLRRTLLVLTVAAIVVCIGPACLIRNVVNGLWLWIEDEFEADLLATWRGKPTVRTK